MLAVLTASVLAAGLQDLTLDRLYHQADHGHALRAAARLLEGDVPYRDFPLNWPPLGPLLLSLAFGVFGSSLLVAKLTWATVFAAAVPLTYRWLRELLPRAPALAGAVVVWAGAPIALRAAYPLVLTLPVALLALQQLERFVRGHRTGAAATLAIAIGLLLGLKHNVGLLVGIGVWIRLLASSPLTELYPLPPGGRGAAPLVRWAAVATACAGLAALVLRFPGSGRSGLIILAPVAALTVAAAIAAGRRDARSPSGVAWAGVVAVGLGVAVVTAMTAAPWIAWLAREDALAPFLGSGLIDVSAPGSGWQAEYALRLGPRPFDVALAPLAAGLAMALAATILHSRLARRSSAALAVVLLAASMWRLRGWAAESALEYGALGLLGFLLLAGRPRALATAAGAGWYAALAFPAPTINHAAVALAPALALAGGLAWTRSAAARVAAVAVLAVPLSAGWIEWSEVLSGPLARVPGPHGGTWTSRPTADALHDVLAAVEVLDPGGSQLVGWPSQGLVVFLAGRSNPTSLDYYWPGFVDADDEDRLIAELEGAGRPPIVVRASADPSFGHRVFRTGTPRLHAWLDATYGVAARADPWALLRPFATERPDQPGSSSSTTAVP